MQLQPVGVELHFQYSLIFMVPLNIP